ncbi:MAG: TolC family protein [Pseudolabrys sp.]|nr:TolC family protein [Pseudolabrys sp.]MDP2296119.1 TolC family protein [Pseudolabrys sp.]
MVAHSMRSVRFAGVIFIAAALLTGCASFSSDGGMDAVSGMTAPALRADVVALRSDDDTAASGRTVAALLKRPLNADSAVQIALLNNRDLQADYNALGIAEAVRVRASLPPTPKFHLSRMAGGGGFEIEAQIVASILALATLPARADIATDRFHQAQLRAVEATLRTGFEARRAYAEAVASRQLAGYLAQAQSSAQAAVDLSKRLGESGSATKLDRARHEVFYAETAARLAGARQRAAAGRERLVRALGLSGGELAFTLPASLPAVPAHAINAKTIEVEAIRRRADLQIARLEVEALAKTYGLTNATRFVNLLEVSGTHKRVENSAGEVEKERGLGVEFQVPLFDFGETSVREAEATYAQAVNRLSAKAVNVASEAREAHAQYRAAANVAQRYRRDVLPLRKVISEETLLRYNAMQIDVFALLAESRERIAATIAAIEAQRDFWLADTNLKSAVLGGHGASGSANTTSTAAASAEPAGH